MRDFWTPLGPAAHEREEAARRFLAGRLAVARDPFARLWSSFLSTSSTGRVYEVDGLMLTRHGLYLVETKSWIHDTIEVHGDRWLRRRSREGLSNPRILAN
jgi:hypothetical protein